MLILIGILKVLLWSLATRMMLNLNIQNFQQTPPTIYLLQKND